LTVMPKIFHPYVQDGYKDTTTITIKASQIKNPDSEGAFCQPDEVTIQIHDQVTGFLVQFARELGFDRMTSRLYARSISWNGTFYDEHPVWNDPTYPYIVPGVGPVVPPGTYDVRTFLTYFCPLPDNSAATIERSGPSSWVTSALG